MSELNKIIEKLRKFRDDRDWKQFHTPSNLSKSIVIEATELLELFQWEDDNYDLVEVSDELADIINYCLLLADNLEIDIFKAINDKINKNEKKYPVEKSYGTSTKYDKL